MIGSRILPFLFIFAAPLAIADCDGGKKAFETTVYRKLQRDCKSCHGGAGPGPSFAVSEIDSSYYLVLNYIRFHEIEGSTLSIRAGNMHCNQQSCNSTSGGEMREQIRAWWEGGQKDCSNGSNVYSSEVNLPDPLPTGGQPLAVMHWDLGIIHGELKGYELSMEVRRYVEATALTPGAFIFQKPRIRGGGGDIAVSSLKFYVNRQFESMAANFSRINGEFSPVMPESAGGIRYPVLSGDTQIVIQATARDRISLGFETLSLRAARTCPDLAKFVPVSDQLKSANCDSCHGNSQHAAYTLFPMNGDSERLCQATLQRVSPAATLNLSPMVVFPVFGRFDHPRCQSDGY